MRTFSWDAIREIIIDRLEGSRRSIKGHEKEVSVRTSLIFAIQDYFERTRTYGIYANVDISERQISIGSETYDVAANLLDEQGNILRKILVPIKTRETEGGGHSHLFTRDILSAINTARVLSPQDFLVVVIVAKNWFQREAGNLTDIVDFLIHVEQSPSEFNGLDSEHQLALNGFIVSVLEGQTVPKQVG